MKYAAGPWKIVDRSRGRYFNDASIRGIHPEYKTLTVVAKVHNPGSDIGDANARLIAASPCLLAALQALVEQVERGDFDHIGADHPDSAVIAAREAIAKAIGAHA